MKINTHFQYMPDEPPDFNKYKDPRIAIRETYPKTGMEASLAIISSSREVCLGKWTNTYRQDMLNNDKYIYFKFYLTVPIFTPDCARLFPLGVILQRNGDIRGVGNTIGLAYIQFPGITKPITAKLYDNESIHPLKDAERLSEIIISMAVILSSKIPKLPLGKINGIFGNKLPKVNILETYGAYKTVIY